VIKRYLENYIFEDLKDRMVFISGPRQVGKTTLAQQIGEDFFSEKYEYLNWDNRDDKKAILNGVFSADRKLFIFDEIHKYRNWKNYLKGEHDKYKEKFHILVTGSAKLDIYRKGGDSLLGRYRSFRLHPLSLGELFGACENYVPFAELGFQRPDPDQKKVFEKLFKFGSFPEVFIKQDEKELRRWHNERIDRLVKEDIRDVENIRDLSAMDVLAEILPGKAGSLFSLNSLREDLNVTHKTISSWVDILEKFYYHFRIYPYQSTLIKSLRKEPKLYLWDWSEIMDEGSRFENMTASHLLKFCHFLFDVKGYKAQLRYLRDKEQREVDFLLCVDGKPWFCAEVKTSFKDVPASLAYFSKKLKIPFSYQVVKQEGVDFIKNNIRVISASKFFTALV
jgi:hypothetical protein